MHVHNALHERASTLISVLGHSAEHGFPKAGQVVCSPLPDPAATAAQGGLAPWQIKRVTSHIGSNLGQKLSLDELSALARLSTSYFSAAFRRNFGTSPYAYITMRRVELAKRLMAEDKLPLCEIALECGLADQAHLSRVFRRVTGTTPSAYRKKMKPQALIHAAA